MSTSLYADLPRATYEGPDSTNPLAFRWYDANRVVLGKTLAEHLRPAVCYWHSFCWGGQDPFALGQPLFERAWFQGEPMAAARPAGSGSGRISMAAERFMRARG